MNINIKLFVQTYIEEFLFDFKVGQKNPPKTIRRFE